MSQPDSQVNAPGAIRAIANTGFSRRGFLRAVGIGGTAILGSQLLAACGDSSGSGAGGAADPDATLTAAYHLATTSLDPLLMTTGQFVTFMYPMYDTLLQLDENAAPSPMLATEWEYSGDGKQLKLTLRDDVKFHDGTAFDAETVKVNIERVLKTETSSVFTQAKSIDSVTVESPTVAVLNLNTPDATLLGVLADRIGAMVSPKAIADGVDLGVTDAGSGAYTMVEFQQGAHTYYERFDGYWNPSVQAVKRIELMSVNDGQARLNGVQTGSYDLAYVTPTQFQAAEGAGLGTSEGASLWFLNIALNRQGPLADPKVRQAISYSIDRDEIAKSIYFGLAEPTSACFPEWYWAGNPDIPADYFTYDTEKAKQLLQEAGHEDLEFELIFAAGSDPYPQFAEILQSQMKGSGITLNVKAVDINQLAVDFSGGKAQSLLGGGGQATDPSLWLETMFAKNGFFNPAGEIEPEVEDALTALRTTTDPDQRAQAAMELTGLVAELALNVPIVIPKVLTAYSTQRIADYTTAPFGAILPLVGVEVMSG
ncbi:MAG: ABC transporter substrate-binding protein [Cumulibacter sp.]